MTYATVEDVAVYTPAHSESGTFTTDTTPTRTAVEGFLNAGYARINGALKAKGYTTPIGSSSDIYYDLVDLEAIYAAARVEMVRLTGRYAPGERGRSQMFMEQFNAGLKELLSRDLSRSGVGVTSKLTMTGWTDSDRDAADDDTDRVKPRFERGQFDFPGTTAPGRDSDDDLID